MTVVARQPLGPQSNVRTAPEPAGFYHRYIGNRMTRTEQRSLSLRLVQRAHDSGLLARMAGSRNLSVASDALVAAYDISPFDGAGRGIGDPDSADRVRNLTVHRDGTIVDRRTGQLVPEGTLTEEEKTGVFDPWAAAGHRRSEQEPPVRPARRSGLREDVLDELLETGEAIRGVAGHLADVHRGGVAAPATNGSFVGWGQLIPKFLRRK